MAIDHLKLLEQKRAVGAEPPTYKCPSCARRTRNRLGKCSTCLRSGQLLPALTKLTTEQLLGVIENARAELGRRAEELKQAIEAAG